MSNTVWHFTANIFANIPSKKLFKLIWRNILHGSECLVFSHCVMWMSQCDISRNLLSSVLSNVFANFSWNQCTKEIYYKTLLRKSNFSIFGANLRNFYLFCLKVNTLDYINPLRPLCRMPQKYFYRCLKFVNFNP